MAKNVQNGQTSNKATQLNFYRILMIDPSNESSNIALNIFEKKKFFLDNFCPPSGTRRQLKTANLGSLPKMDKYGQILSKYGQILSTVCLFSKIFSEMNLKLNFEHSRYPALPKHTSRSIYSPNAS